ncbi:MAG: hypothetical protein R2784_20830 [Saprospiraceae bacterium]
MKSTLSAKGNQNVQIDVDFLSKGMYWLLVRYRNEYKALKFTKI